MTTAHLDDDAFLRYTPRELQHGTIEDIKSTVYSLPQVLKHIEREHRREQRRERVRAKAYDVADKVFAVQLSIVGAKDRVVEHVKERPTLYAGLGLTAVAMACAYRLMK